MDFKAVKNLTYISQIAFIMLTPILGGVYLGNYLDTKWGTSPWILLIGVLIGIATAFMSLFKFVSFAAGKEKEEVIYKPNAHSEKDKEED